MLIQSTPKRKRVGGRPYTTAQNLADRFWVHVDKDGPIPSHRPDLGPCWIWTTSRSTKGDRHRITDYGLMHLAGEGSHRIRPSRVSWLIHFGELSRSLLVCHHCDNPPCVNPGHLFLGTHKDNTRDAKAKGRLATGDKHGTRTHPEKIVRGTRHHWSQNPARGEAATNSKLKLVDVLSIISRYRGGESQPKLAKEFGVHVNTIYRIIHGLRWRHVTTTTI